MSKFTQLALIGLLPAILLVGCGGGGGDGPSIDDDDVPSIDGSGNVPGSGDDDDDGDGDGGGSVEASGVSYVPLAIYESYSDFSGFDTDDMFQGEIESPLIKRYVINPINAATMDSVADATASDYRVTIDDVEIDASESYPILQRVIGANVQLRTALVFDLSDSVNAVDMPALVQEAKDYVAAAQASSNGTISSQEFVVWAFGLDVDELTSGFTSDAGVINAALDQVATLYASKALGISSNLHQAVVEAVGRFNGDENGVAYNFRDGAGDNNDLVDFVRGDAINQTHLVIFSSGPDTALGFSAATMAKAVESQSQLRYDIAAGAGSDTMRKLKKPVFYYVVGRETAGQAYSALSDVSERTTSLTLSGAEYSFASGLISNQIAALGARVDLDQIYMFRFAFLPRVGDHTSVFSSTSATGFNYSLTSSFTGDAISPVSPVVPSVEITGPNGEYIANRSLEVSGSITLRPVTRWTPDSFGAGDYSWNVVAGALTGTANPDGSYTVTAVTTSPATLRLTNSVISDSFEVDLTN